MTGISVVIITFNEEQNIERCLSSVVGIADEIIVVDSLSTDRTKEICLKFPVKFIEQAFLGYIEQKNKALEFATNHYVLSLDADEALSPELHESIRKVKENIAFDGYTMSRLTNYCGHWVYHCGWYPDRKLRLFDKRKGRWAGQNPHDQFRLDEGSNWGYLKGDILHYSYYSIDQHIDQVKKFTAIMAADQYRKGKRPGLWTIIVKPFWRFIRQYFIQLGFLDGYYGFVICIISAFANFIKYLKIRELFEKK